MAKRPGTGWEETVLADFSMLRPTANSGAVNGDGDLRHQRFLVECKDEGGDAIKFPYSDLVKIRQQALAHGKQYWMRFFRNGKGDKVVSMNYEFSLMLLQLATETTECPKCKAAIKLDW